MRDRFVTWGTRNGERSLFTFELDAEEAQIIRRVVPPADSTEELLQTILNAWNNHTTVTYPAGTERELVELTASGTIVPPGGDVDDKVRVASAEREWPFDVVSARLRKQFRGELEELADVIHGLEKFEDAVFERLKGAWNKVQTELNNKVLRYEHSHDLRKLSDELFEKIKILRRGKEKEVRSKSKELKKDIRADLKKAQTKLEEQKDLRALFKELQRIQERVNKAPLAREDRNALRRNLDELFKATKSEITATEADASFLTQQRSRLEKRLAGLEHAIKRMKHSVHRDNQDMFYENRRIERAGNQLAEQLGAAKMQMLQERADSKQAKLDDMLATEADLRKKLDKLAQREQKAQAKREAAEAEKASITPIASSTGKPKAKGKRKGRSVFHPQVIKVAATVTAMTQTMEEA